MSLKQKAPLLAQRIHAVMEDAIASHQCAGMNALILQDGEEICYVQAGHANIAKDKPISRDSIFRLYSQTKPVTAVAAAILIENGTIDLCDPVSRYLPGFADPKLPDGKAPMRGPNIMDLLGMTAGLCYPEGGPVGQKVSDLFWRNQRDMRLGGGLDTQALCNELGRIPLLFEPGSQWHYSTCADVLGAVIEVASGKRFGDFLRENIFEPLEMNDTAFWTPADKADRLVTCYKRVPGSLEEFRELHLCVGDYSRDPAFESGGAGLVSTLDDYSHFASMLLGGGRWNGKRILAQGTVEWLTEGQLNDQSIKTLWMYGDGYNYGKLMRVCEKPGRAPGLARRGEYGWDGWLGTYFANFPEEHVTILSGQNTTDMGTGNAIRRIRNVVLSEV